MALQRPQERFCVERFSEVLECNLSLRLRGGGSSPPVRAYEVGEFETFPNTLLGGQLEIGPIESQIHSRVPPLCSQHQLVSHQVQKLRQGLDSRRNPFLLDP